MFVNDDRKKVIIVFKNIIVSSLNEVVQETQPRLFVNFTDYLVDFCVECFPYKSESIFKELLVMLRRVSPCDAYIFNKKNACDFSYDDDYTNSFEDKIDDKNEKDGLDLEYDSELEPGPNLESDSDLEPDSDLEIESD